MAFVICVLDIGHYGVSQSTFSVQIVCVAAIILLDQDGVKGKTRRSKLRVYGIDEPRNTRNRSIRQCYKKCFDDVLPLTSDM